MIKNIIHIAFLTTFKTKFKRLDRFLFSILDIYLFIFFEITNGDAINPNTKKVIIIPPKIPIAIKDNIN
jgi:hypothetical protein